MGIQVYSEGGNTIKSILVASQGQGHHHKEKWSNLYVQVWEVEGWWGK